MTLVGFRNLPLLARAYNDRLGASGARSDGHDDSRPFKRLGERVFKFNIEAIMNLYLQFLMVLLHVSMFRKSLSCCLSKVASLTIT